MVVFCCVVGYSNRAKKTVKKLSTGFQVIVNQGEQRQLLRRGNNFRCNESCLLNFTLYTVHNGSQGMINGCPGLIEEIGIHQNMTGYALISFDRYTLELACKPSEFFLKESPHHITSRTEQAEQRRSNFCI